MLRGINAGVNESQRPVTVGGYFVRSLRMDGAPGTENNRAENLRLVGGSNRSNPPETGEQPCSHASEYEKNATE
jgi:hypothetical protein